MQQAGADPNSQQVASLFSQGSLIHTQVSPGPSARMCETCSHGWLRLWARWPASVAHLVQVVPPGDVCVCSPADLVRVGGSLLHAMQGRHAARSGAVGPFWTCATACLGCSRHAGRHPAHIWMIGDMAGSPAVHVNNSASMGGCLQTWVCGCWSYAGIGIGLLRSEFSLHM